MREDYCLAALAEYSDADIGFVADEEDKYLLADSKVKEGEFKPGEQLLAEFFVEAKSQESQFPLEMETAQVAEHLGLSDMGRIQEREAMPDRAGTIPLWSRRVLENDENHLVMHVPFVLSGKWLLLLLHFSILICVISSFSFTKMSSLEEPEEAGRQAAVHPRLSPN